jgi:hypothetical protein
MLTPAPVVTEPAAVFRDRLQNQRQLRPFHHELPGLLVWPNKRLAHRARGLLDRADNTPLSRVLAEAPWWEAVVKRRRGRVRRPQTKPHRSRRRASLVVLEDTLGEPGGRLLDDVDRPDHHRAGTDPLAHHPVPSCDGSGPVRCPRGRRLSRRAEALRQGEAAVATHVPERQRPAESNARHRRHQQGAVGLLQAPELLARHAPVRTPMALALAWVAEAIRRQGPVGVGGFEAGSLAQDVGHGLARRRQDWSSWRTTTRRLEPASCHRREAKGGTLQWPSPPLAAEARGPGSPATASRPVQVRDAPSGGVTLTGRLPGWGKGRRVVSFAPEALTGRDGLRVTNRLDGSAAQLRRLSSPRWPPATCAQARTGDLGVHESRRRRAEALGQPWGLVFVASALGHLTCLPAGPERTRDLLHTMGDAWRHPGRALLQRLWRCVPDQWSQGPTVAQVLTQLVGQPQGTVRGCACVTAPNHNSQAVKMEMNDNELS